MRNTHHSCREFDLSHTHASAWEQCFQVRNTDKTEKCACDEVFCLHLAPLTRDSLVSVSETP